MVEIEGRRFWTIEYDSGDVAAAFSSGTEAVGYYLTAHYGSDDLSARLYDPDGEEWVKPEGVPEY